MMFLFSIILFIFSPSILFIVIQTIVWIREIRWEEYIGQNMNYSKKWLSNNWTAKLDTYIYYYTVRKIVLIHTVANYRPSTVWLQLKTLLPCILDLTPAIEVTYYWKLQEMLFEVQHFSNMVLLATLHYTYCLKSG